ncbi:MAG: Gfo/Idh/MocA family oxidoreductase [Candidatus Eremiobacteraeota bacterium]|nr:Gfo/Idh/MocA family oxidoreductase [Candidatus Eremiobacteraeota bacterium]
MIRLGLVGYGYWGPNYARIIEELPDATLTWCADVSETARAAAHSAYPQTRVTPHYQELLDAPDCDAVIVAAPTRYHFEIARDAFDARKHLLVEKPLTDSFATAAQLADLADRNAVVAMVGHIFRYHPVVRYVENELRSPATGPVRFIAASRLGYSPIREDVDALWDLAPHDISMIHAFLRERPMHAFAVGHSYYPGDHADVVFGTLQFPSGALASLRLSWAHPFKERRIDVVAENATFVFDDLAAPKLSRYDGLELDRNGATTTPMVPTIEPLRAQLEHFIECIERQSTPRTGFRDGEAVVATLEALTDSMRSGAPAFVPQNSHQIA